MCGMTGNGRRALNHASGMGYRSRGVWSPPINMSKSMGDPIDNLYPDSLIHHAELKSRVKLLTSL
jgi:hypothetical protein